MLVLTRKPGERIVIGQTITITVVETRGGRVRLGIAAPNGTPIHREEVFARLARAENGDFANDRHEAPHFFVESN